MSNLEKIENFIKEHHVLTLATHFEDELSACSVFYAYEAEQKIFIFASANDTTHIQHILQNPKIAGNILLETQTVTKIQGLQFQGECYEIQDKHLRKYYFDAYPYAKALMPKLWKIEVNSFKMTDNRLGFGKKLHWRRDS